MPPQFNPNAKVITLTTDFGWRDSYVGQLKGRLSTMAPAATLIDISHDLEPFDIRAAAWTVFEAVTWYPPSAVHLVVVDPGVAGSRDRLILEMKCGGMATAGEVKWTGETAWLVGPDNGVFSVLIAAGLILRAWRIENYVQFSTGRPGELTVFEGRDIFGPVAARLAAGDRPDQFGPPLDPALLATVGGTSLVYAAKIAGEVRGAIVKIDRFGNCATNIAADPSIVGNRPILVAGIDLAIRPAAAFEQLGSGEPGAIINSQGCIELCLKQNSFCKFFGVQIGCEVKLAS